ncbi:MAG: hypothetical protein JXA25_17515 [Anaerolineales bacterium]|nr:hypothetical protein [Anaerolineales bacterium]
MFIKRRISARITLTTAFSAVLLLAACMQSIPSGPGVWIDAPLDGSVIQAGEMVEVLAHAYAEEGMVEMQLLVNGVQIRSQSFNAADGKFVEFSTEWSADPGDYALQMRAVSADGVLSYPAVVNVKVAGDVQSEPVVSVTPDPGEATETATPSQEAAQTATGTIPSSVEVSFQADNASIMQGTCTMLRWNVANADAVTLDGVNVALNGSKQICPNTTTSYYLHIESTAGPVDRSVQEAVQVPTSTSTPTAQPTATVDTQPPVISAITESADPIRPPSCSPDSVTINATITDPSGVPKQNLYFRVVSGAAQGVWVWRSMTEAGGDVYQATIGHDQLQASLFPYEGSNTVLQYYIKAWDSKTNQTQSSTGEVTVIFCVP